MNKLFARKEDRGESNVGLTDVHALQLVRLWLVHRGLMWFQLTIDSVETEKRVRKVVCS